MDCFENMEIISNSLLERVVEGLGLMWAIGLLASAIVFIAMVADCIAGVHKAKLRGEERNSHRLSRSINKFLIYEGTMIICVCADTLIHFVWAMLSEDTFYFVPIVCCLIGILLCAVEFMSIREKADEKTRRRLDQSAEIMAKTLDKDALREIITEAIKQSTKNKSNESK